MKKITFYIIFLAVLMIIKPAKAQKVFTDTIKTDKYPIIVHVLGHASVWIEFDTLNIYVDPYSNAHNFTDMPKADLIMITHAHQDHYDFSAIAKITQPSTTLIYTQTCATTSKFLGNDTIMKNGDSIQFFNIPIIAVPAYNLTKTQHPKGIGNGYIITLNGKRIYFSGDSEEVPEMYDVKNIDLAFMGLSQPYNMTAQMMANVAIAMKPKELIPYHYDNNDPSSIVELLKGYPEIKVLTGIINQQPSSIPNIEKSAQLKQLHNTLYVNCLENNMTLNIFDFSGKSFFVKKVYGESTINLDGFKKGIYIATLTNSKKQYRNELVIK